LKSILLFEDAELELWEAVDFYEKKSPGLGLDFEYEIRHGLEIILGAPHQWPFHTVGTRRYILNRFPFSIIYLDPPDIIWVVAIAHQKRHPQYWQSRIA
jgi:toxin ParE1/3/4